LVVTDPGCAWTLGVAYAKFGIGVEFEVSPWVSEVVDRIGAAGDKPRLELQASYHDACYLGRGLGEYDAPRRILARVVEGTVGEAVEKREDAGCSGGGGLLPATRPEASKRMAEELARELGAPGRTVVTACPTAMRSFTDSGADAADLAGVVAQWLRQGSR
jgi:Fe-S oxidoreductase